MSKIKVNFDETPDEILPLTSGVYTFVVKDCKQEFVEGKNGKEGADVVTAVLQVDDEASPNHGRQHWERFYLNNQFGPVMLKKFAKSAGVSVGKDGVDCEDFIGKHVKARMQEGTYKDANGDTKPNCKLKEWLFQ